jgi:hypothetical protein
MQIPLFLVSIPKNSFWGRDGFCIILAVQISVSATLLPHKSNNILVHNSNSQNLSHIPRTIIPFGLYIILPANIHPIPSGMIRRIRPTATQLPS